MNFSPFPVISAGESQALTYYAKVSGDAVNAEDVQAAQVIITISIVYMLGQQSAAQAHDHQKKKQQNMDR